MQNETIINSAKNFIKKEFDWLCIAHDLYHFERVYASAIKIFEWEQEWDELVVWLWAIFHEMSDDKFFALESEKQVDKVINFLDSFEINNEQKEKIIYIVENLWYGKSLTWNINKFIEFQIVEEADRLDAIWAIAIARTFAYWWKIKSPIYDPEVEPLLNITKEEYYKAWGPSINHFYEKLLKLKDEMRTKVWKEIAQERHIFMEKYLEQFFAEWNWER